MKKIIFMTVLLAMLVVFLRPVDKGKPYSPYFASLNNELKKNSHGRPLLVLDMDRLDRNINTLVSHLGKNKKYRIVTKSLPSIKLIDYISRKTGTLSVMVFHQPFINLLAEKLPRLEMLLGKPMPVHAAKNFYRKLKPGSRFNPSRQLQWLIDSEERLKQYLQLAQSERQQLRINIELDVGLHRGGVQTAEELHKLLAMIRANPEYLAFSGFMGYDAHVAKAPPVLSSIDSALKDALSAYNRHVSYGKKYFPELFKNKLTFNSAGSMTYQLYKEVKTINDISAGSGLVKPTDFDLDTLKDHVPALFIATPVLKKSRGLLIPYLEFLSGFWGVINPNWRQTCFVYGGFWKAKYHEPPGLFENSIYGHSSNQEIVTSSEKTMLGVDDFVFLRPTQSEAVMLQFGDLVITRGGKIIDQWPVMRQ